jgi:molybdopterin-guanine dinucleotide biosynthesis protein A
MNPFDDIHTFVLAGGRSSRLNMDKAFLRYDGRYFIDIVIECAASLFGAVTLVGKRYEHPALLGCLDDDVEGVGPLGGILTALRRTSSRLNFFVGIDYPFIDAEVLAYLAGAALKNGARADGLVPRMPDGLHPLHAFYAASCLGAVERCIEARSYRVQCIAKGARILQHDIPSVCAESGLTLERFEKNFVNINSYEEYLGAVADTKNHLQKN